MCTEKNTYIKLICQISFRNEVYFDWTTNLKLVLWWKTARGFIRYKRYRLLFIGFTYEFLSLVPQELILVTAPKLQEDEIGSFNSSHLYLPVHASIRIARGVPLLVYMNLDVYSGFWCTSRCVVF